MSGKEVTADEDEHDSAEREHENGDDGLPIDGSAVYATNRRSRRAGRSETLLEAAVEAGEPAVPAASRHGARP